MLNGLKEALLLRTLDLSVWLGAHSDDDPSGPRARDAHCFSVVPAVRAGKRATLDLEARDASERDELLQAIQYLIDRAAAGATHGALDSDSDSSASGRRRGAHK